MTDSGFSMTKYLGDGAPSQREPGSLSAPGIDLSATMTVTITPAYEDADEYTGEAYDVLRAKGLI